MVDEPTTTPSEPAGTTLRRFGLPTWLPRYMRRTLIVGIAIATAAIVSFVTIDLGPVVRAQAEQLASARIERPVHIGRLGTYLLPGRFLVEDLVIEGLSPEDEPFFTAERIVVSTSWLALLGGEILVDSADMGNWRMVVESFPDGHHSFPRLTRTDAGDPEELEAPPPTPSAEENEQYIVTTVSHLLAHDGEFVYRDHGVPWSAVARNIDLTVAKADQYGGRVSFSDGTVRIGAFEPMTASMEATYELDGGLVNLTRIDLTMDGFESMLTGEIDLLNWPEQIYQIVESDIELPPMKDIFFAEDEFTVTGEAQFTGVWHIFDGGRELTGSFRSENATLSGLAFPQLDGSLVWTRDRFAVSEARSGFYGGALDFTYSMKPLGAKTRGVATFETTYSAVDLGQLFEALEVGGARPDGRATGHNLLQWPLGRFSDRAGEGHLAIMPPDGVSLMTRGAGSKAPAAPGSYATIPFSPETDPWQFPLGGAIAYSVGPEWVDVAPSRLATPYTEIEFRGRTKYGGESRIPFRVASADWQESDRLMSSMLTAFGASTREIAVGGHGQLDGVMLGTFASPRIEASFAGEDIQAWNVSWGSGRGAITVEDAYLHVADGMFSEGPARLQVDGRFALGYRRAGLDSRDDGGDEIDASFHFVSFPARLVRDAFSLDGYDIDGPLTGEIRLFGDYRRLLGVGRMALADPVAYGEPFDSATADLRFEGTGVRIERLEVRKGGGLVTGAAFIRWDGTYSFSADGRDIAVASVQSANFAEAPLGGRLQFTVAGVGAFDDPRYDVRGSIADLAVSGEIVGQVSGRIDVRDGVMGVEVEAASPRLAISGSGRVELMTADAELLFRFTNTSIDPYVRAFQPDLSAGLTAEVSGTLRLNGELRDVEQLLVDVTVEQLDLDVFDYAMRNDGPLRLALDHNVVRVEQMQLVGDGTALELSGTISLSDERIRLRVDGDAGLDILQRFFPDIRSSGNVRLAADISGTLRQPLIIGEASVKGGRMRHLSLPHGLESIDGQLVFEPDGVRFDSLTGELGGGAVRFGGRLRVRGYEIGELNVTASGTQMRLRFPEGVRSLIDAELTLGGDVGDPVLSGTVTVRDAILLELFEAGAGLLDFTSGETVLTPQAVEPALPLRLDVRISALSSLRISDSTARIVSSAELTLRGTYDQPLLFGNAEIERGEVFFQGNRYRVTRGNIGFANPNAVEPFFDIEAETDIRVPGQTYRVTLGVVGTMERLDFELASDPPLPEFEIMSLLLGNLRDPQAAELRTLRAQEASRQELFQAGAAQLLTLPLSSGVGRVVEESFGVDTFEIMPSLVDPSTQQSAQLVPTARLLIGKRISDRAHVTLSRTLTGASQDIIVVLEYDQNDRLSWILSQNEDRTYALDFRVRHAF